MNTQLFIIIGQLPDHGFYVYELVNPLTNLPFYVGKGKNERYQDHLTETNNRHKFNTIKKILKTGSKVVVKIVLITLDENQAFNYEKDLIQLYGRRDNKTGILTNLTNGGEGVSGYTITEELRLLRSEAMIGNNNPMYGKSHTNSSKQKMSSTRKNNIKSGKIIPTKHTEEWKQHLRENNAGGKATSKQIYQIGVDGNVIKLWNSTKQAGESLNIKSWRNISDCANKYPNRIVGGFYWKWIDDKTVVDSKLLNIDELNNSRTNIISGKQTKQVNLITNEITVWKNQSDCARKLHLPGSSLISRAIKTGKPYLNSLWYKV